MKLMLKHKIMGLVCIAALLPTVVMLALAGLQKTRIGTMVIDELNVLIHDNIGQIVQDVYHTCESAAALVQFQVDHNLVTARKVLNDLGEVKFSTERVTWQAVNQSTQTLTSVSLPKMLVGSAWLGQNQDPSVPTPVVDEVTRLGGTRCTIFQKMNEQGDMLRVATNVETAEHKRAIGTYIAASGHDGSPNPVIATVLRGAAYRGRAFVVNDFYTSAYEPIRDREKKIIGMLFVGAEQKRLASLSDNILQLKVGKTGRVFVIGAKGEFKGRYIISDGDQHGGENIWEQRDLEGKPFIQSIVSKALTLRGDQIAFVRYLWKSAADAAPSMKMAAIAYYEPWDWVIVASANENEFYQARNKLEQALSSLFWWSVISGLIATIIALTIALVLTSRVTGPIGRITGIAQQVAQGDLLGATNSAGTIRISGDSSELVRQERTNKDETFADDETGLLLKAIRTMTQNLNSLVGQVKHSSIQLVSTSTQIAAASKQQEATVNGFGASTNEVVVATKEISATSQELVSTMNDVTGMVGSTASLAGIGRKGLEGMEVSMRQLADATHSISRKLAAISEKANNINSVVTTITKVADETNLLSLNAAIEAEKAGEYGLGFSVVAREIRRLADQTAVATLDIEQMVKEMRSAVSAGVMEMDKFTEEVRRGVEEAARISTQLGAIIEQVQALTPRFETVNRGVQVQAQGAKQINKAMVQLNEAAKQTAQSLREFNKATEQLNESARGLRNEVSRFTVSE